MKGDRVPDKDHIARYCGGAKIDEDGNVTGPCFELRSEEEYLSVNWLELLHSTNRTTQLEALRDVFTSKGMRLGATAKFAVHQVGKIREHIRSETTDVRELRVLHEPIDEGDIKDLSHCGVYDMRPDADLIADLVAQIINETYPAKRT